MARFWHQEARIWRTVSVGDGGVLRAERIPAGEVEIRLDSRLHPWKELEPVVLSGEPELDLGTIRLEHGEVVRGELTGLPDPLYAGITVTVGNQHGKEATGVELNGRYMELGALAPGGYLLNVLGEGVQADSLAFVVEPGQSPPYLRLALNRAGVREVLLHVPGPPNGRVHCELFDANGRLRWQGGGLPEDGRLTVRVSAEPGSYRLRATKDRNGPSVEQELAIHDVANGGPLVEVFLTE